MTHLSTPRLWIPVELRGPARFTKLHSEIIDVARVSVDSTCYAGIHTNKQKFKHVITCNGLWSHTAVIIIFWGNVISK